MRSRFSKLAVAAVLASSLPALAAARDCDHDPRLPAYAPPATYPAPHAAVAEAHRWHGTSWREREAARLRIEFRELDRRYSKFHARHHGRGQVRRFERWYAARLAELQRRWNELHLVAWR